MATAGDGRIPEFEQLLESTRERFKRVLPEYVILQIFIRLLAKQVAQLRTLSSIWKELLSDPRFVSAHLLHSFRESDSQILMFFEDYCLRPIKQYTNLPNHLEATNFIPRTPNGVTMIGSAKGLVCLHEHEDGIISIWNPSLSARSNIPQPQPQPQLQLPESSFYQTSFRFGFDPHSQDFKVVMLTGVVRLGMVLEWLPVQVYSTNRKSWATIPQACPSHITMLDSFDRLCVDGHGGHLHWTIVTTRDETPTILAFDLGSEEFSEILLPQHIPNISQRFLGVFRELQCDIVWFHDNSCEVWVMERYGVPESWTRSYVSPQFAEGFYGPIGFSLHNDFFLGHSEVGIVLFEIESYKIKRTPTPQQPYAIVDYQDSLFWI